MQSDAFKTFWNLMVFEENEFKQSQFRVRPFSSCNEAHEYFNSYRNSKLLLPNDIFQSLQLNVAEKINETDDNATYKASFGNNCQCTLVKYKNVGEFLVQHARYQAVCKQLYNVKNVVHVYFVIANDKSIVTEYIPKYTPINELRPVVLTTKFIPNVVYTLSRIHNAGVFLRHISEDTISVKQDGEVYFTDISFCTVESSYVGDFKANEMSHYYPPESRINGNMCSTKLIDVYTLGMMLYRIIYDRAIPLINTEDDYNRFLATLQNPNNYLQIADANVIIKELTEFDQNKRQINYKNRVKYFEKEKESQTEIGRIFGR